MRLTTVTNISLDGVTQGHRRIDVGARREDGPEADGAGGFERFGWGPPLLDEGASMFISRAFQRAEAFLFGRRTYEIFAGSWGAGMDPGNPVGEALNSRPKYVASTTLGDPQWAGTTVLSGHRTRTGRCAVHPQGADDPDLPHHRPPAVRDDLHLKLVTKVCWGTTRRDGPGGPPGGSRAHEGPTRSLLVISQ